MLCSRCMCPFYVSLSAYHLHCARRHANIPKHLMFLVRHSMREAFGFTRIGEEERRDGEAIALHKTHIWANSLKPVCFLCFLLIWCPLLPFIETGTLKIYTKMVLYMKNEAALETTVCCGTFVHLKILGCTTIEIYLLTDPFLSLHPENVTKLRV